MRKIVQIGLLLASCGLGYWLHYSINAPIRFEREKTKRFTETIARLKDLRSAQDAHLVVKGSYAKDFQELINFVETGKFAITTQRDTSWTEFDKNYKIDVLKQGVVVDTLRHDPVKETLFGSSDRYKYMMYLPDFSEGTSKMKNSTKTFDMQIAEVEKGNYKSPVYEIKASKKDILVGLDENETQKELLKKGINDVKGEYILVGSLTDVSNSGNWPTLYDAEINKRDAKPAKQ